MDAKSDASAQVLLSEQELTALLVRVFVGLGVSQANAPFVASVVAAAERDGAPSHGLQRMVGYAGSLRSGWVDGKATPRVEQITPCMFAVDGANGFTQVALAAVRTPAILAARSMGVAVGSIRDAHHFAALWPDVESFADEGLIAVSMVNTRSLIVVWGGRRKVLGTNPMAFACPRSGGPPIVWDQASSLRAQGEVLLAQKAGHAMPEGAGVDSEGHPTTDPTKILDGGALLPFGGAKGGNLAFAIEILVALFGGGPMGFEAAMRRPAEAQTSPTGQFLLLLDPERASGGPFGTRLGELIDVFHEAGTARLPGDRRYENRARSRLHGIPIATEMYRALTEIAGAT